MKNSEARMEEAILRYERRGSIGLAFSGGVDSLLLAEFLHRLKISFVALHFDHRWRGQKSAQDAEWVKNWCEKRNIPVEIGRARQAGATSENTAREARWKFFEKATQQYMLKEIWMAHHADDLVETFLMQMLRGAGLEGLASLRSERMMGEIKIVRPWLEFFKEEIIRQAKAWKLKWREDASNKNTKYFRNRVRGELIPFLSKISGREVKFLLRRTAILLAEENRFLESFIPSPLLEKLPVKLLKSLPDTLQRRCVKQWLKERSVQDVSFENVEAVRGLLQKEKPAKINLSQGKFCRRKEGFLFIA
ncbi:MAG: tRNA lysidine(34) synthetase TilS [Verrucomicrobiota bacterium]